MLTFCFASARRRKAAWAAGIPILAAPSLLVLVNHFKGTQVLASPTPTPKVVVEGDSYPDLVDIKDQETAKRALELPRPAGQQHARRQVPWLRPA